MAEDKFAPYAPAKAVLAVIERFRDRGLPDPLTTSSLEQIGIQASNAPRTLQALRFLGLVDEGGNRLPAFEGLRTAKTTEYPDQLAEILRAAYLPIFTITDPAEDTDVQISDAFRGFQPSSQREKMVSLFMALCRAAGIVTKAPTRTAGVVRREPSRRPAVQANHPRIMRAPPGTVPRVAVPTPDSNGLFGVTEEDLSLLDAGDFQKVWDALGIVAMAKMRARAAERAKAARPAAEIDLLSMMGLKPEEPSEHQ
jgi:Family of unknown function (DUF5343)